ncbi:MULTISPECIES: DUF2141 domain-containing protein [Sphingomonas]|uniref:DUF2141 domain-containing protein n=1 Tax=Sphingomonas molluscorum TaxID=418184 RepID=A0ABU8Q725_9SPHN|nr:DUF2141 domain-containing protein [Sphingomonas sp. JUb134]MBM7406877.1 uncharacterized protein (DUF2141 family) [Sphingomonas sp. JUb134]
MSRTALAALALLAGATALSAPAQAAPACVGTPGNGKVKLEVAATSLRSADGEVAFTVYPDDSSRFLKGGAKLARARVKVTAPTTRACFWLAPGHYALATYHDENGDHKFNRTTLAPKEGYGFSNDAPTTFSLPAFKATRFPLPASGGSIAIRTRYGR